VLKKKFGPILNFQRLIELFTKKIVKKFLKIWSWDPGSGKNLFRIPDPGVKKAPDPGSGSATMLTVVVSVERLEAVLWIRNYYLVPDPTSENFGSSSGSIPYLAHFLLILSFFKFRSSTVAQKVVI
jgi:hypothetical protein